MMQGSAESPEVQQAFLRTRERYSHPIEQVDDLRSHVAHPFDGPLVGEKVSAVHGVVKMLRRRITLALRIDRAVYTTLRAYGMRALHRYYGDQVDLVPGLGYLHRR